MKVLKKSVILVLGLVIISLLVTACQTKTAPNNTSSSTESKSSKEKIVLKYADVQADNDPETLAALEFSRIVKEKSDGRIEIQVFPNGQLGDMKDIMQAVQMGAVDICRNNPAWLADAGVKKLNVYMLPFIFRDLEHANKVVDGEIGYELLTEIKKANINLVGLGYFEPSARHFFFNNKQVKAISDIKGLKLRVPTNEMNTAMVEALGASSTPIPYNELYTALQTGIVDGAENPLKGYNNMKFYEVCKYFTFTGHQYEPSIVLFSEFTWNKLSDDDKNLIKDAFSEASQYYKDISGDLHDEYVKNLEKQGVIFSEVDNPKEWRDAVAPLYEKYGDGMEDLIVQIQNIN